MLLSFAYLWLFLDFFRLKKNFHERVHWYNCGFGLLLRLKEPVDNIRFVCFKMLSIILCDKLQRTTTVSNSGKNTITKNDWNV